jgi:hypothetical protein
MCKYGIIALLWLMVYVKVTVKCLGAIKPKVLNRIAKIGYGHLCLREENISFDNNYSN